MTLSGMGWPRLSTQAIFCLRTEWDPSGSHWDGQGLGLLRLRTLCVWKSGERPSGVPSLPLALFVQLLPLPPLDLGPDEAFSDPTLSLVTIQVFSESPRFRGGS